jgi:peroxiredoxin Q/BCP
MATPALGAPAPDFTLDGWEGGGAGSYTLSAARGAPVVLAFYPGDDTMVCTRQLCSYQDDLGLLSDVGATVWGISPQDMASHQRFATRRGLTFPLLADPAKQVIRRYGVDGPLAIKRSVFVVDAEGLLRWSHVAPLGLTYQSADTLARVVRDLAPA